VYLFLSVPYTTELFPMKRLNSLTVSLSFNIILIIVFLIFNKKSSFKLLYGVYWDKNKNPHCPRCQKPIGQYDFKEGYWCINCNTTIALTDNQGQEINAEKAISDL
jgi:hypothetical protein